MPIALNPQETFKLSTARDREVYTDPATRPVFRFHYLTGGEWREHLAVLQRLDAFYGADAARFDTDAHEAVMLDLYEKLATQLTSWTSVRDRLGKVVPFDRTRVKYVMGDHEARELFGAACRMSDLRGPEKNSSGSPSPSSSDKAAPAAATAEPVPAARAT